MRAFYDEEIVSGNIIVVRRIEIDDIDMNAPKNVGNGKTLAQIRECLYQNSSEVPKNTEGYIEVCIQRCVNFYECILEYLDSINKFMPTILSKSYARIDELISECKEKIIEPGDCFLCRHIIFLEKTRDEIEEFYLKHPYRVLQMSEDTTRRIMTVENCLTSSFLPYVLEKRNLPNWVVPRSMRILNEARKVLQTQRFVKEGVVELQKILLTLNHTRMGNLSECLIEQIALYAIDISQIIFDLYPVITEEMLLQPNICKMYQVHLVQNFPRSYLTI